MSPFILTCLSLLSLLSLSTAQSINLSPLWDTTRVLENPHKGWYHHYPDNGTHRYPVQADSDLDKIPGLDHVFIRLAWNYYEPTEGNYDWKWIDDIADRWVPKGYQIGIAISAKETYPGYATPKWVFDAGAKGALQNNSYWEPDFDDPIFLEKLNRFHAALGKRYAHKPWLAYVQMASYGSWGEGHNWPASLKQYSFATLKKHIDIYRNNYPGVKICISDDVYNTGILEQDKAAIKAYVEQTGLFWTDHSIFVTWHATEYAKTFSVQAPALFDATWKNRPVQLELEHYQKVKAANLWSVPNGLPTGQSMLRGAIDLAHATYVGYHGFAHEWFADNPDITRDLVNRIGYWFFPVSLVTPPTIKSGGTTSVQMTWKNRGVAPAYNRYYLEAQLSNQNQTYVQRLKEMNNLVWMPEEAHTETYSLQIPGSLPSGTYYLSIRIIADTLPGARKVELPFGQPLRDTAGFYRLTQIELTGSMGIRAAKDKTGRPVPLDEDAQNYLINGRNIGTGNSSADKHKPNLNSKVLTVPKVE